MEIAIVVLTVLLIGVVIFYVIEISKKNSVIEDQNKEDIEEKSLLIFTPITSLSKEDESKLVPIQDERIVEKIISVSQKSLKAIAKVNNAVKYSNLAHQGDIYQAIIPAGEKLDKSRAMRDAFRATYRHSNGQIAGQANLKPMDNILKNVSKANVINATYEIAALVVGQHYMAQISSELDNINKSIAQISQFQNNEYYGKLAALVANVKKISQFKVEIMEDEDTRKNTIQKLSACETTCIELLGHADKTLSTFIDNKDFKAYENEVKNVDEWFKYQQMLIEILKNIDELNFVLNEGKISKEQCYFHYLNYSEQVEDVLIKLKEWHLQNGKKFEIDIEAFHRKRKGFDALIHKVPAIFNKENNYKDIDEKTVEMIKRQSTTLLGESEINNKSLFEKDTKIIEKDGEYYYLPE